ncbi:unnamed protein product [Trifolium pratense]|uniref:Uncharacterized protein n=1 Tax=Trifolium pratense TaxID=57577 RepID=A0ACB0LAS9_TRIPR|nr:unnamed protein product [Trifolium pratense]
MLWLMNECFKLGKIDEAVATFRKVGTKPNEVVIKGLCAEGLLDKSREMLDEVMRYGVGVTPALRESVTEVFKNARKGEEIERLLDTHRPPPTRPPKDRIDSDPLTLQARKERRTRFR